MPTRAQIIENARAATDQLRDHARTMGLDHKRRDPLVMAIHAALDLAAAQE